MGCNAAFQLMLGYTLDDLKNDFNITQLVPPRMSAHAVDLFTLLYSMNANGYVCCWLMAVVGCGSCCAYSSDPY